MGLRDLLFYRQEYIFIVNETVFEDKILNRQSLHVYRPKQLSVMQDFFVLFWFKFNGIMFKIERAGKYRKL